MEYIFMNAYCAFYSISFVRLMLPIYNVKIGIKYTKNIKDVNEDVFTNIGIEYMQKPIKTAGHFHDGIDLTSWSFRGNSNYTYMTLILSSTNIRYIYIRRDE